MEDLTLEWIESEEDFLDQAEDLRLEEQEVALAVEAEFYSALYDYQ